MRDYLARSHCDASCALKAVARNNAGQSAAYWPQVTGEIAWEKDAFAKHNLNFKGGRFVTLPRPLNHSPTGNSASLLVEAAR